MHTIKEMFRVLKSTGKLVIADWNSSTPDLSECVQKAMGNGFNFVFTYQELKQILLNIGFADII